MNKATDLLAMLFASIGAKPAPKTAPGGKAQSATDAFRTLLDAVAPPGDPPPSTGKASSARPALAEGALPEAAEKKDGDEPKAQEHDDAQPVLVAPAVPLPQLLEQPTTKTKPAHEPVTAAQGAPPAQGIAPADDRAAAQPEQQPAAQPAITLPPVTPHAHSHSHHHAPKRDAHAPAKIDDAQPTSQADPAQPAQPQPAPKVQVRTPIERLTQTVKNVVHVISRNGQSEARITVEPAHLGRVEVRLHSDSATGTVTVELRATSPEASQTLQQGLPELRRTLEDGGLQVGDIEVRTQAEDLPQDRQQPQDHQQSARGGSNRSAHEIEEEAFDEVHVQELGLVDVLA